MGILIETSAAALKPFDDERGRMVEELAFDAKKAADGGNVAESIVLYTHAAELEESSARDVPVTCPLVRRALGRSAEVLWRLAGKKDESERVAIMFGVAESLG